MVYWYSSGVLKLYTNELDTACSKLSLEAPFAAYTIHWVTARKHWLQQHLF